MNAPWWHGIDVPTGAFFCDICVRTSDRDEWMATCRSCEERFCRDCTGPVDPESTERGMVGECRICVAHGAEVQA